MDSAPRMLDLLSRLGGVRIGVVGDLMIDRFIYGDAQRISPEAPVPVVSIRRRTTQPGGAANVAANVISLGGRASLFGALGDDAPGHEIRHLLTAGGCDIRGVIAPAAYESTVKTRVVAQSQQMLRIDEEHAHPLGDADSALLLAAVVEQLGELDVLLLSDYAKGVITARLIGGLKELCESRGIPLVVDPKPSNMGLYAATTVVKPNLSEALRYVGWNGQPELADMPRICESVRQCVGAGAVIITAGSDGMHVFNGAEYRHITGHSRGVFDVAGAGDTAVAAVALALGADADLFDAAELGNLAGSIAVGKLGVAAVAADELRAELEGQHGAHA